MTNTFDILLKDNTISLEKRNISTSSIFFVFWAVFFLQLLQLQFRLQLKCLCLNFLKGSLFCCSAEENSLFFFESKAAVQPIFFYSCSPKLGYLNCSLRLLSVLMSSKKKHTRVSSCSRSSAVFMFVFVFVFVFFSVSFSFFKQLHTQILFLHSNQLTLAAVTQQKEREREREREREGNFCFCVNCSSPKKEAVRTAAELQLEEVSNVTHCKEVKTRVILFNNIPNAVLTHLASSLQYMCLPKKKHNKKRVSFFFCSSLICPAAVKTQWAKKTAQESNKTNDIVFLLKQQAPFCFFFTELKREHSVLFFLAYFRHLHEQTQLKNMFYLKNCSYTKRNTNTNANANANTNINTNTNTELQNCFGWFFCSARDTLCLTEQKNSSSANKKTAVRRAAFFVHLCFFSTYNSALAAVFFCSVKLQNKKQKINTPFLSLLFLSLTAALGSNKKKQQQLQLLKLQFFVVMFCQI